MLERLGIVGEIGPMLLRARRVLEDVPARATLRARRIDPAGAAARHVGGSARTFTSMTRRPSRSAARWDEVGPAAAGREGAAKFRAAAEGGRAPPRPRRERFVLYSIPRCERVAEVVAPYLATRSQHTAAR